MSRYRLSELVSVALPASAAAMLVSGVLLWRADWINPALVPLLKGACLTAFAVLGAAAVAAASCMAGHAQAALVLGRKFRSVYLPAVFFGLGYAMAGAIGVHIGWEVLTKPDLASMHLPPGWVVVAASLFLALGKPVFAFVLEGRKQVDKHIEAEADREMRAEAEKREERQEARKFPRLVTGIGAIGAAAALAGAGFAGPVVEPPKFEEASVAPSKSAEAPSWVKRKLKARYAEFASQLDRGASVTQAARAAGVAESTAFYWAGRMRAEANNVA